MPIYEYQCDSCGTTFDAIQKFSDPPLSSCRSCGTEGVRKLISAPAFRLKGGGWYETDFKKGNQRNVIKSDSDGGSSGSSGSDSGKSGSSSDKSSGSDTSSSGSSGAASAV